MSRIGTLLVFIQVFTLIATFAVERIDKVLLPIKSKCEPSDECYLANQDTIPTDIFEEIQPDNGIQTVSKTFDNGLYSTLCWVESIYLHEFPMNSSVYITKEYSIVLETPSDIPSQYEETDMLPSKTLTTFEIYNRNTKKSRKIAFETVEEKHDHIIRKHKQLLCGSGPVLTKEYQSWPNSNKRRVEIKVSPKNVSFKDCDIKKITDKQPYPDGSSEIAPTYTNIGPSQEYPSGEGMQPNDHNYLNNVVPTYTPEGDDSAYNIIPNSVSQIPITYNDMPINKGIPLDNLNIPNMNQPEEYPMMNSNSPIEQYSQPEYGPNGIPNNYPNEGYGSPMQPTLENNDDYTPNVKQPETMQPNFINPENPNNYPNENYPELPSNGQPNPNDMYSPEGVQVYNRPEGPGSYSRIPGPNDQQYYPQTSINEPPAPRPENEYTDGYPQMPDTPMNGYQPNYNQPKTTSPDFVTSEEYPEYPPKPIESLEPSYNQPGVPQPGMIPSTSNEYLQAPTGDYRPNSQYPDQPSNLDYPYPAVPNGNNQMYYETQPKPQVPAYPEPNNDLEPYGTQPIKMNTEEKEDVTPNNQRPLGESLDHDLPNETLGPNYEQPGIPKPVAVTSNDYPQEPYVEYRPNSQYPDQPNADLNVPNNNYNQPSNLDYPYSVQNSDNPIYQEPNNNYEQPKKINVDDYPNSPDDLTNAFPKPNEYPEQPYNGYIPNSELPDNLAPDTGYYKVPQIKSPTSDYPTGNEPNDEIPYERQPKTQVPDNGEPNYEYKQPTGDYPEQPDFVNSNPINKNFDYPDQYEPTRQQPMKPNTEGFPEELPNYENSNPLNENYKYPMNEDTMPNEKEPMRKHSYDGPLNPNDKQFGTYPGTDSKEYPEKPFNDYGPYNNPDQPDINSGTLNEYTSPDVNTMNKPMPEPSNQNPKDYPDTPINEEPNTDYKFPEKYDPEPEDYPIEDRPYGKYPNLLQHDSTPYQRIPNENDKQEPLVTNPQESQPMNPEVPNEAYKPSMPYEEVAPVSAYDDELPSTKPKNPDTYGPEEPYAENAPIGQQPMRMPSSSEYYTNPKNVQPDIVDSPLDDLAPLYKNNPLLEVLTDDDSDYTSAVSTEGHKRQPNRKRPKTPSLMPDGNSDSPVNDDVPFQKQFDDKPINQFPTDLDNNMPNNENRQPYTDEYPDYTGNANAMPVQRYPINENDQPIDGRVPYNQDTAPVDEFNSQNPYNQNMQTNPTSLTENEPTSMDYEYPMKPVTDDEKPAQIYNDENNPNSYQANKLQPGSYTMESQTPVEQYNENPYQNIDENPPMPEKYPLPLPDQWQPENVEYSPDKTRENPEQSPIAEFSPTSQIVNENESGEIFSSETELYDDNKTKEFESNEPGSLLAPKLDDSIEKVDNFGREHTTSHPDDETFNTLSTTSVRFQTFDDIDDGTGKRRFSDVNARLTTPIPSSFEENPVYPTSPLVEAHTPATVSKSKKINYPSENVPNVPRAIPDLCNNPPKQKLRVRVNLVLEHVLDGPTDNPYHLTEPLLITEKAVDLDVVPIFRPPTVQNDDDVTRDWVRFLDDLSKYFIIKNKNAISNFYDLPEKELADENVDSGSYEPNKFKTFVKNLQLAMEGCGKHKNANMDVLDQVLTSQYNKPEISYAPQNPKKNFSNSSVKKYTGNNEGYVRQPLYPYKYGNKHLTQNQKPRNTFKYSGPTGRDNDNFRLPHRYDDGEPIYDEYIDYEPTQPRKPSRTYGFGDPEINMDQPRKPTKFAHYHGGYGENSQFREDTSSEEAEHVKLYSGAYGNKGNGKYYKSHFGSQESVEDDHYGMGSYETYFQSAPVIKKKVNTHKPTKGKNAYSYRPEAPVYKTMRVARTKNKLNKNSHKYKNSYSSYEDYEEVPYKYYGRRRPVKKINSHVDYE